jgi:hypothetical protein
MKISYSVRPVNEGQVVRASLRGVAADLRRRILARPIPGTIRFVSSAAKGIFLLALVALGAGCASPTQYISPRVTGRVLDAQTRQPLAKVQIQRVRDKPREDPNTVPRGAQAIQENWYAYTDAEGRFTVDSTTTLTFLQRVTWYSVTLAFSREGYMSFTTNYTPAEATFRANGEPVVNAGTILLRPLVP